MKRPSNDLSRFIQITVGGMSGLTAVALILGAVAASFATTTRQAATMVAAGVTITVGVVGGFVVAPYLSRLASRDGRRDPRYGSSSPR